MKHPSNHSPTRQSGSRLIPSAHHALGLVLLLWAGPFLLHADQPCFAGQRDLRVMTRNVYIGALLDPIVTAANPQEIPVLVAQTLGRIAATDFPARAGALAREIVEQRPDVVGLQEITLLRIQAPGDFLGGNPVAASQPLLDYLQLLRHQLAARGAAYHVVALSTNWDVELPMVTPTDTGFRLDDLRATDYDVILVRADLPPGHLCVLRRASGNYATAFQISIGGFPVAFPRGWCLVDLFVRGRTVRVINTHLESVSPLLRSAQAAELVAGPAKVRRDLVCLGDFNSDPAFPAPEAYGVMAGAGFSDAWAVAHPRSPGYTWGQADDLLNPLSTLSERDDYVWFRGEHLSVLSVRLTGDQPADRVPSLANPQVLLWPSDHAGVSARLRLK